MVRRSADADAEALSITRLEGSRWRGGRYGAPRQDLVWFLRLGGRDRRGDRRRRQAGPILSTHSYVMRRGGIGATRQRTYATNVATASSTTVVMAELTSPRIR